MAINYAEKYSSVIDERFGAGSYTNIAINNNYDFTGVNKINVYSTDTVPLNNYDMTATGNRYGTPTELGNDVQSMTLTQDKSFTFTIDRRNYTDTEMSNSAGLALDRQINQVIIPTIDKYRIGVIAAKAGETITQDITAENAYYSFLDASTALIDKKAPFEGRIAFVSPLYYKLIKQDKSFTAVADKAHELAVMGNVGMMDGTRIILIPTAYLPAKCNYIITHPSATLGPVKLTEYNLFEKPQGISGWLVEGRVYYDAFVLNNKKDAILVSKAT